MRRLRFRIGTLLILIIVLGVGFAALRESNDIWDSGVFTLALAALLVSILLAMHRSEARRAFWIGFALFGAAYLGLSLVPSINSRLITTKALASLDSKLPGRSLGFFTIHFNGTGSGAPGNEVQSVAFTVDGRQLATSSQGQVRLWDVATGRLLAGWGGTTENFVRIGHSLFALMAGWSGGLLSRRLWRASRATAGSTPINDEGSNL
jgi:hypothetical protein